MKSNGHQPDRLDRRGPREAGTRRGLVVAAVCTLGMVGGFLEGCAPIQRMAPPPPPPPVTVRLPLTEVQQQTLADAGLAREAGRYDEALVLLRSILAQNPAVGVAYVGIGQVHLARADYKSAEPAFARAVRLEPRSFDAQYGHGLTLQMLSRFIEAVRSYQRALVIRPDSAQANSNIATTYLQMGRMDSALDFAESAIALDPARGPAHANLATIYESLGRNREAITEYEVAIELMEATGPLLGNLIIVLAKERRYLDAFNTAQWLVRLEPSAKAYERLGWCAFRVGDYEGSIEAYRTAVEQDPDNWAALNGVGCNALNQWLLGDRRDRAQAREARDAFRRSLTLEPDQPKVVRLLLKYQLG